MIILNKIDTGINTFPIIDTEVFALPIDIYKRMVANRGEYRLVLGTSFQASEVEVEANPDILLGKHLGVFGNTGTGKSCTVVSILQGLKRRLDPVKNIHPKVVIFDANNEYENAFSGTEYSVYRIPKEKLRISSHTINRTQIY